MKEAVKAWFLQHFWSMTVFHSFWQTFVPIFLIDTAADALKIVNGDWHKAALAALVSSIFRAILKAIFTLVYKPEKPV